MGALLLAVAFGIASSGFRLGRGGLFDKFDEAVGLTLPNFFEFDHFGRHLSGKVLLLGSVSGEIVQLPWISFCGNKLPFSNLHCAIAFVQPPETISAYDFVFTKGWRQTLARCDRSSIGCPFLWLLNPSDFQQRRNDVDNVSRSVAKFVCGRDSVGPVGNEG